MSAALLRVFPSPAAIGEDVAQRLLQRIELAQISGKRFLLGCPTGRTPRPVFDALARELSRKRQDMSRVVLVMMDEYLAPGEGGLRYAPANNVWSCHYFARVEIAERLNDGLPPSCQLPAKSIWFPEPGDPEAFESPAVAVHYSKDSFSVARPLSSNGWSVGATGLRADTSPCSMLSRSRPSASATCRPVSSTGRS